MRFPREVVSLSPGDLSPGPEVSLSNVVCFVFSCLKHAVLRALLKNICFLVAHQNAFRPSCPRQRQKKKLTVQPSPREEAEGRGRRGRREEKEERIQLLLLSITRASCDFKKGI